MRISPFTGPDYFLFTVIHQVLPKNRASSVRKICSQIALVQLYGIALNTALEQALPNGGGRTLERFCDFLGVLSLAAQHPLSSD